nr:TRAP transporter small permease [Planctomycetota bacterium]
MSTAASHATEPPAPSTAALVRALAWVSGWLVVYSAAAVRRGRVAVVVGTVLVAVAIAGNVFTRNTLGFSVFFSEDLARFSFLWVIWMGVSLAVKRGAVTVITFVSDRGPAAWQRSVKTFSGVSLAILLGYACVRATQFATGDEIGGVSSGSGWSFFYPVASMAVGYYFITLHYAQQVTSAGVRALGRGLPAVRDMVTGVVGGFAIGAVVWGVCWGLLELGVTPLIPLGVIFVALTLSGTPIVFMLSIAGIIAMFSPDFLGL